jgi:hypothetical protein
MKDNIINTHDHPVEKQDEVLPTAHHTPVASTEPDDAEPPIERDYSGITDVGYLDIIPVNK